jgi:hypothetical protein
MAHPPIPLSGDLRFPGNGLPPRPDADLANLTPWSRMIRGQPLGQKGNLYYDASEDVPQLQPVTLLDVQGDDCDACPIAVTLHGRYAIPNATIDINVQGMTGELDNANIGTGNYPGTLLPINWPPIVAIVEWGCGGTRAVAYVDWKQGATINVPASFLRVHAMVPPDAINAPGTTGVYTVGAFAAYGQPRNHNATRTIFLGSVDGGGAVSSGVFAVPPFANRATVLAFDPAGAVTVATLQFWRSPDGTVNAGNYLETGNVPGGFRVPNGAAYFSVISGMAAAAPFAVCFELSI